MPEEPTDQNPQTNEINDQVIEDIRMVDEVSGKPIEMSSPDEYLEGDTEEGKDEPQQADENASTLPGLQPAQEQQPGTDQPVFDFTKYSVPHEDRFQSELLPTLPAEDVAGDTPKDITDQIAEYQEAVQKERLSPLLNLWNTILEDPKIPQDVKAHLETQFTNAYTPLTTEAQKLIDSHRNQLFKDYYGDEIKTVKEQMEYQGMERQSSINYQVVAQQLGTDSATLDQLIFGKPDGKGGMITPGFGHNMVMLMYEQSLAGSAPKNQKAYADGLTKWWTKFSSNQNNLMQIANVAITRYKDYINAREQATQESNQKRRTGHAGRNVQMGNQHSRSQPPQGGRSVDSWLGHPG
jgi:hypothetical protein